jgi:16S rRNA (guanine966-N2)-methyltransferase
VVAGSARGRRLDVPPGSATRPTSDRVREAVFNALDSLGAIDGARALDAFAGSGALGIEALSRGAAHVTFVEADASARAVVAANLEATGLGDHSTLTGGDGARSAGSSGPWDLVLLDPPYAYDGWPELLDEVARGLAADGVVVVESDRDVELPSSLCAIRSKRYGGTVVTFASPTGAAE